MTTVTVLRWLHIIGSTVLFGTGLGIAFFMLMAHRTRNAAVIAHTAGVVVIADYLFTATAVIVQPVTGALLVEAVGWSWSQGWLVASIGLYVLTGTLWLPVVRIQVVMRNIARAASANAAPLPARYFRLFRLWFAFGIPAFLAVLAIFWLMVAKPA
ncbi:MAG: DUF2269 domain-containing protein, partial [Woeseiaceae bacterium]|nr:DUF2269 domain-containing protein [Woeseiaceae bacterium]